MSKVFLGSTFNAMHELRGVVHAAINRHEDCKTFVVTGFGVPQGGLATGKCSARMPPG